MTDKTNQVVSGMAAPATHVVAIESREGFAAYFQTSVEELDNLREDPAYREWVRYFVLAEESDRTFPGRWSDREANSWLPYPVSGYAKVAMQLMRYIPWDLRSNREMRELADKHVTAAYSPGRRADAVYRELLGRELQR